MKKEMIFAGFGGQGVMLMGRLVAYSGMTEEYHVSWMPSYGPEMRGGTANCTVIVSEKMIPSPLSSKPDIVVAMNLPSMLKFVDKIKPGGKIYINESLINQEVEREDIEVIKVPANKIANELGESRIANMVMLGSIICKEEFLPLNTVKTSLKEVLPPHRHNLLEINNEALDRGCALA